MGITVISSSSTPSANANSAQLAASTPADSLPVGFAALLSGQIKSIAGLPVPLGNDTQNSSTKSGTANDTDTTTQADQTTLDPTLAFLMGIPVQAPPTATATPPAVTDTALSSATDSAEKGLASLGNLKELPATSAGSNARTIQDLAQRPENPALTLEAANAPGAPANIAADAQAQLPTGQDLASALNANALAGQQTAASQTHGATDIATPLHSSNWTQDFSQKIVWLAKNDQQTAQININPPQLGPLQITLQINGDQASAVFASPHAEVRQAIENSLPQLKEMLAGAGINLGQADVGANMAQQNREAPTQSANGHRSTGENAILPGIGNVADSTTSTPVQRGRGMVDLFA